MKFNELPKKARVFILFIFFISLIFLIFINFVILKKINNNINTFLFLLIFIVVSDIFRVQFSLTGRGKMDITLSLPATFSSIFLFNPFFAAIVSAIGSIIGDIFNKKEWFKIIFNFSQIVLTVGISSLVYRIILNFGSQTILTYIYAVTLSAILYLFLNSFYVSTITGLVSNTKILEVFLFMFRRNEIVYQFLSLFILGGLFTYILQNQPFAMILLIPILIAVYYSFKRVAELEEASELFIETIAKIVDNFDKYTEKHSENVAKICEKVANELKLPLNDKKKLITAAKIHDFGKIGIPQNILNKNGKLTDDEYNIIKEHPILGANLISKFPYLKEISEIIKYHHIKLDGSGYPVCDINKIPKEAKILSVCDVFEALTSGRPYREKISKEEAIKYLEQNEEKFDKNVVKTLRILIEKGEI